MHSWMAMSWVRKDLTLYFSRKSGSKGARIQTTVSQSQKMNYCWAESDWNWKSRCTKNQKGKRNKWERRKKVNHPNSKVGCWASDRHTIAFKKWVRVAITRMRPFLWWKQSQPPWGPFVSSMHRPSPPWWTFSAVPLVQAAIRGLHFWRDSTLYVQYVLSDRCQNQCMTHTVWQLICLGEKRFRIRVVKFWCRKFALF